MNTHDLDLFLSGGISVMMAGVGLFFLKYWRETHDRLFLALAASFWLQAVNRVFIQLLATDETRAHFYWVRLVAYLIIIWAIIDKNRSARRN